MRLDFHANLNQSATTVTVGKGDGSTAWTNSLTTNGWQLYQDVPTSTANVYRIRDASTKTNSFSGSQSDGFLDISDSTNGGVLAFIRNFWQSWPNAIKATKATSGADFSVQLFPSDGGMLEYNGTINSNGYYWLDDMVT